MSHETCRRQRPFLATTAKGSPPKETIEEISARDLDMPIQSSYVILSSLGLRFEMV